MTQETALQTKPRPFVNGSSPELVLFDLDGTLIDSVPSLALAVDRMLLALERPAAGETKVRQWVGNGAEVLVRRALSDDVVCDQALDDHLVAHAHQLFLDAYGEAPEQGTELYPGVLPMLEALQQRGIKMAVVTNKPERFVPPLLDSFAIAPFFGLVLGGDSLSQKKPHPAPLLHVADHYRVDPGRCLMVGDSKHDIEAARAAGFAVAAVTYGYNHGQPIEACEPDWVVDSLIELL